MLPPLENPWVLTALAILAVVVAGLAVRVVHRLKHGKTSTEFAPLPVAAPATPAFGAARVQHLDDGDNEQLLAKGA